MTHVNDVLCRLLSALREVHLGIQTFMAIQPGPGTSEWLLQAVQEVIDASNALHSRLTVVLKHVKLTTHPIILEGKFTMAPVAKRPTDA